MKHSLPTENFDIETSTVPHTHGEDEQQKNVAPKRACIEDIHRGELCQDGIEELSAHEHGFPVMRWKQGQERSNDAPLGFQEVEERGCPLSRLNLLPPIDENELPI